MRSIKSKVHQTITLYNPLEPSRIHTGDIIIKVMVIKISSWPLYLGFLGILGLLWESCCRSNQRTSPSQLTWSDLSLSLTLITLWYMNICMDVGVEGIGEKRAAQYIAEYGNIENLLKNCDQIKQKHISKVRSMCRYSLSHTHTHTYIQCHFCSFSIYFFSSLTYWTERHVICVNVSGLRSQLNYCKEINN